MDIEDAEEQEQKDGSKKAATVPLIECLCRRNTDVLATVTGADVLEAQAARSEDAAAFATVIIQCPSEPLN